MSDSPAVLVEFGRRLAALGWVSDLLVAGSLATGDYLPRVSDLDLIAVTDGPVDAERRAALAALHRDVDLGIGLGLKLGCAYVNRDQLVIADARHPTWTHGRFVDRVLSGIPRAELVRYGYAVFGRPPNELLPPMTDDDVRAAARSELTGYWASAVRHPTWWLNETIVDLSLTSMARGRHTMSTGELLTKSRAIELAAAPAWLIEQLRVRRQGATTTSPRVRAGLVAWRDARRTVARARG